MQQNTGAPPTPETPTTALPTRDLHGSELTMHVPHQYVSNAGTPNQETPPNAPENNPDGPAGDASIESQSVAEGLHQKWSEITIAIVEGRVVNTYPFFLEHALDVVTGMLDQLVQQEVKGRDAEKRIEELSTELDLLRAEADVDDPRKAKILANEHPEMKVSICEILFE